MRINVRVFIVCCVLSLFTASSQAQQIFDATKLHEIRLNIPQPHWFDTLDAWYNASLNGADKQFMSIGITIDGQPLAKNSGIRFKGDYSYLGFPGKKKPFRIHFNKFTSGQTYEGIKKINLHNFAGDPSFLREYVAYDMFRYCGIAASHTSFTKLYINNVYWGCYLIAEEPEDKQFLTQNFTTSAGNLFDENDHDRLTWKGADPELYDLKLQTDLTSTSWNNIFKWIQFFNTDSSYDFDRQLNTIFDVEAYMKILALDVYMNNWDSYPVDGRNFFIYDNPASGKLQWIPWDYNLCMWNNTLALFPHDGDTQYAYKPLIARIHGNDFLRDTYYRSFCKLLNNQIADYPLESKTLAAYDLIKEAVESDTQKFYTNAAFYTSRTDAVTVNMLRGGVPADITLPGITALLNSRKTVLKNELKAAGCDCDNMTSDTTQTTWHVKVFPNPVVDILTIYTEETTIIGQAIQVTIYTAQGKRLQQASTPIVSGTATIDLSALPTGNYLLRLTLNGQEKVMKIVKI